MSRKKAIQSKVEQLAEIEGILMLPEGERKHRGKPIDDKEIMRAYKLTAEGLRDIKIKLRGKVMNTRVILDEGEMREAMVGAVEERHRQEQAIAAKAAEMVVRMGREGDEEALEEALKEEEEDVEVVQIKKYLMRALRRGNATAGQVLLKLKGRLVEKQEVRHGLTADEIARRNIEAERELKEYRRGRGEGQGMAEEQ